ncbi:MAG: hypothetical protein MJY98_09765 [Fibrobacter sp.]|nr:hypothetical protein [Fibrobacter sp.]
MRNGKMKFSVKNMSRNDFVLGCVIPFFLFWGGILTPVVTDSLLVWICCLVPLYIWIFLGILASSKEHKANLFLSTSIMILFFSFVFVVMLFFIPDEFVVLKNMCRLSLLNFVPSVFLVFFASANSLVEGCKGTWFHPGFW